MAVTPRPRLRRDLRWIVAGVLAVVLGGLGSYALFDRLADARPALKLTRTVYRGQQVAAGDLAFVSVPRTIDAPLATGDDLKRVVGSSALTDLPVGSLLTAGSYGAASLQAGTARVGVRLEPGRLPSTKLHPGSSVLVVVVPTGQSAASPPTPVAATVAVEPVGGADGAVLLDLDVAASAAEQVARWASLGQVALVWQGQS